MTLELGGKNPNIIFADADCKLLSDVLFSGLSPVTLTRWSVTMVVLFSSHAQYLQCVNKHTWNENPEMLKSFVVQ